MKMKINDQYIKKVYTVNEYSIIKYYYYINLFETRYVFHEIKGLESNLLIVRSFKK